MRYVTYNTRLDVRRSGSQASIRVRQGEQRSRKIVATLTDGGKPLDYEWLDSVILRAVKPDETVLFNDCELLGSTITYIFDEQMEAVEGAVTCEFLVYGVDGAILYSPKFDVFVEGALYDNGKITSRDEFTTLINALATLNRIEATEEERQEAELGREDAEALRDAAEQDRAAAEAGRVAAEAVREAKMSNISVTASTLKTGYPATASVSMTAAEGIKLALGLPRGEKGETGLGFKLVDYFATPEELYAAVPNPVPGNGYGVGTNPVDVYIFGEHSGWKNYGQIKGAVGDTGATGAFFYPTLDDAGNLSWWNNGDLENPQTKNIKGPKGEQGEQGIQGVQGVPGPKGDKGDKGDPGADAQLPSWVGSKKPSYSANEIALADTAENYEAVNVEAALAEEAAARKTLDAVKAAKSTVKTGTLLASNWTGTAAPYAQTVHIDGVGAATNANADYEHSSDLDTEKARATAWSRVSYFEQGDGYIKATCIGDKPEVDLPLKLMVIG